MTLLGSGDGEPLWIIFAILGLMTLLAVAGCDQDTLQAVFALIFVSRSHRQPSEAELSKQFTISSRSSYPSMAFGLTRQRPVIFARTAKRDTLNPRWHCAAKLLDAR